MIKRTLFVLLLAGLMFAPIGLFAQKAYNANIGGFNRIILDMSETGEGIGMPKKVVTNIPKVGVTLVPNEANNTVYEKLEIAPHNMGGTNANPQLHATGSPMPWTDGDTRCRGLNYNGGGGWRLPTQREMIMIWIFRDALVNLGSTPFTVTGSGYWTATEFGVGNALTVNFDNGGCGLSNYPNPISFYIRCVRELP